MTHRFSNSILVVHTNCKIPFNFTVKPRSIVGETFLRFLSGNNDQTMLIKNVICLSPVRLLSSVCIIGLALLFAVNEYAFDLLYCIAFKLMDQQWLSMHASYMEFNVSTLCNLFLMSLESFRFEGHSPIWLVLMLCLGLNVISSLYD